MKTRNPNIDLGVVKSALSSMKECELVVGHYFNGPRKMDMPFLRTRSAYLRLPFPKYQKFRFMDTWGKGRALYSLTSNRLGSFGDMYGITESKTQVDYTIWKLAHWGDKIAMKYVVDHNIKDVKITYQVHKKMENLVPIPNSYI